MDFQIGHQMFNSISGKSVQITKSDLHKLRLGPGEARGEVGDGAKVRRSFLQGGHSGFGNGNDIYADAFHFCDSAPLTLTESFTKRILSGQLGPR